MSEAMTYTCFSEGKRLCEWLTFHATPGICVDEHQTLSLLSNSRLKRIVLWDWIVTTVIISHEIKIQRHHANLKGYDSYCLIYNTFYVFNV